MAKPELGFKRQCMSCGAKFYDLNRSPAVCPKCGTVYQAAAASSTRVAPPVLAARAPDEEEPEAVDPASAELVSLEDVEAAEAPEAASEDDIEIGDVGERDAFLEEEEAGEDDATGLIDGDSEDDEEA